jgi:type IV secretion system protein VirB4
MPLTLPKWLEKKEGKLIDHEVIEQDFVPYACHYDPYTILTKNGELMQVVRITGFAYEALTNDIRDLRATIREAITSSVTDTNFAICIHTLRRAADLQPDGEYPPDFSGILNAAWTEHNGWDNQFLNEIFITVIHQGEQATLKDTKTTLRALNIGYDKRARESYYTQSHEALERVTIGMLQVLAQYGAQRLGLVHENGLIYSDILKFLDKLVTLTDEDVPLPQKGLDDVISQHIDIAFGSNVMEVRNYMANKTRYGALLSLKEYHEVSLNTLGRLLQMPIEFVISQSLDFINAKEALESFEDQAELYEFSGEKELARSSGLTAILASNRGRSTDYGEHQITVFVMADTLDLLEKHLRLCVREFSQIGMSLMREDMMLEEGYWAQLPGNFPFLRRLQPINTASVGGFALLNNLPSGRATNVHWGNAITLFYTAAHTPYFFNFHLGTNGHTMIVGPKGGNQSILMNFLVSEARKCQPKLFYFDQDRSAEIFVRSLGGAYWRFLETDHLSRPLWPAMNPLQLPDNTANRTFLLIWLEAMLQNAAPGIERYREQFWPHLAASIDYIYTLPPEQRRLKTLAEFARIREERIGVYLGEWHSGGTFSHLFDHETDALDLSGGNVGFNLSELTKHPRTVAPVVAYLLHRVMNELDGYPAMLVLKEAWQLLENPLFSARLGNWLDRMRSMNTVVLMASEQVEHITASDITPIVLDHIATQIFMPNRAAGAEYVSTFHIAERDVSYITAMDPHRRHFLLKRGSESIVAEMNMQGLEPLINVLVADADRLRKFEQLIAKHGENVHAWLPDYLQMV